MLKSNPCPYARTEREIWNHIEFLTRMAWDIRRDKRRVAPKGCSWERFLSGGWERGRYSMVRAEIRWLRAILAESDYPMRAEAKKSRIARKLA